MIWFKHRCFQKFYFLRISQSNLIVCCDVIILQHSQMTMYSKIEGIQILRFSMDCFSVDTNDVQNGSISSHIAHMKILLYCQSDIVLPLVHSCAQL